MEETRKHIASKDCWCNPEVMEVPDKGSTVAHRVESADEALRPLQVEEPQTVEVNVVMGAQLRAVVRSALIHVRNKLNDLEMEDSRKLQVRDLIDRELVEWPLGGEADDTLAQWLYNRFSMARNHDAWEELEENQQQYWEHEAAAVRRAVGRGGFRPNTEQAHNYQTQASRIAKPGPSGEIKGLVPMHLKEADDISQAIRWVVGAASMCWSAPEQAGVFKSEEALDIATQLEHYLNDYVAYMGAEVLRRHQALGERLRNYRNAGQPTVSIAQVYAILTGTATPEEYNSALQVRPGSAAELGRPTDG